MQNHSKTKRKTNKTKGTAFRQMFETMQTHIQTILKPYSKSKLNHTRTVHNHTKPLQNYAKTMRKPC